MSLIWFDWIKCSGVLRTRYLQQLVPLEFARQNFKLFRKCTSQNTKYRNTKKTYRFLCSSWWWGDWSGWLLARIRFRFSSIFDGKDWLATLFKSNTSAAEGLFVFFHSWSTWESLATELTGFKLVRFSSLLSNSSLSIFNLPNGFSPVWTRSWARTSVRWMNALLQNLKRTQVETRSYKTKSTKWQLSKGLYSPAAEGLITTMNSLVSQ